MEMQAAFDVKAVADTLIRAYEVLGTTILGSEEDRLKTDVQVYRMLCNVIFSAQRLVAKSTAEEKQ